MTIEEFLARLEAKLDWLIERMEERDARMDERDARWEGRDRDMKQFMDDLFARHARVTDDMIRAMQEGFAQLFAESNEQRRQLRANTEATWRMLDRFGEGPA